MSKLIYACSRRSPFDAKDELRLTRICKELEPDNLPSPATHRVAVNERIAFAVMNAHPSLLEKDSSLLLGCLYAQHSNWDVPKTEFPDGSYAILRNNDDHLEAVSDPVGSRTIWYYFDDDLFLASTSERAIIMFLGDFMFDRSVIPWMLSTGSLGPELSWDKRVQRVQPDSSVVLAKKDWTISINQHPFAFFPKERSYAQHKQLLQDAVSKAITSLRSINYGECALSLSGGYDSRGILCFIDRDTGIPDNLKTVTWGLKKSIYEEGNDAKIAKDVARVFGVQHRYYHTDLSQEPIERVIDRFLFCGEGRTDKIPGYMDGLDMWRKLKEEGVNVVIRGEELFGWAPVPSEIAVKYLLECASCSEFANLEHVTRNFGLPAQRLPVSLQRRKGESLTSWRDRLHRTYREPTIQAALSDIKFSYVEQVCPLLSRSVLDRAKEVPDRLRTGKPLFKDIVKSIGPNIPFASKVATAPLADVLRASEIVELLRKRIQSESARQLLGSDFVEFILSGIQGGRRSSKGGAGRIKTILKSFVPSFLRDRLRHRFSKPRVDGTILAFRVFIILRMWEVLSADCANGRSWQSAARDSSPAAPALGLSPSG